MDKKKQTGLWIPYDILYSDLTPVDKMILSDIRVLSIDSNVFVKNNKTLASMLGVSIRTIERSFASMYKKELIWSKISYPYGNHKKQRNVYIRNDEALKKLLTK